MPEDVPAPFLPAISRVDGIDATDVRTSRDIRRASIQAEMDRMDARRNSVQSNASKPSVPSSHPQAAAARPISVARPVSGASSGNTSRLSVARPVSVARPASQANARASARVQPQGAAGSRASARASARLGGGQFSNSAGDRFTEMSMSDRELALRLNNEMNHMDEATINREVEDNRYAQRLLEEEISQLESRRDLMSDGMEDGGWTEAIAVAEGIAHLDYMRPTSYKPWFSFVAFLTCTVMLIVEIGYNGWAFEEISLNPTFGPSADVLLFLGAKKTSLIVEDGEWWRLLTPMILHAGIIHLLFNMLGLFNIGVPAEREFGSLKIGAIFLVSGLNGVLLSAIFVPQQVGVGASGAIFGLFGAAWADLFQNWGLYRGQAWKAFFQLLFATIVNLLLGLVPYLDNFAHLGGFIAGFIFGLSLLVQNRYWYHGGKKKRKAHQLFLQGLSVIVLPSMMVAEIMVLYLEVNATEWCGWCSYISCVPMPPGAATEADLWWDCSPCSAGGLSAEILTDFGNGTGIGQVTCPDQTVLTTVFTGTLDPIAFCKASCP